MPLDTSIPLGVQVPQFGDAVDPATRQYNALRMQALQQEMARNQLIMQNTMQDRARAEADRARAAANAAAELRRKQEFMQTIRSGYDPGKTVGMGPGTIQGSTPASYDPNRVLNALYAKGDPAMIKSFSDMQEQLAKQQKAEAEVPGTAAESRKKGAEADKAEFSNAFDQMSVLAPYIASGAMPARAAVDALLKHPVAGKLLSSAMTPEQMLDFADKNPQGVAQILATPPDKIYESLVTSRQPKPSQVSAGANLIDTNPQSPTYGQIIGSGQSVQPKAPTGYRYKDDGSLEAIPGGPAAQGEGATLTPDALDIAANTYILSGTLPPGMGKNAVAARTQIMNRAAELKGNQTPEEFAKSMRVNKNDTGAMAKADKDFSTGKQGQMVNSFNTAIDHLETVTELVDALNNNDMRSINKIGNTIAKEFGVAAPASFDAAKQLVSAEIIKAINSSGGALADREEAEQNLDRANTPAQLKSVVDTYQKLLGGQLNSLKLQYTNTVGKNDFDKKLTPKAKAALDRVTGSNAAKAGTTSSGISYSIED